MKISKIKVPVKIQVDYVIGNSEAENFEKSLSRHFSVFRLNDGRIE